MSLTDAEQTAAETIADTNTTNSSTVANLQLIRDSLDDATAQNTDLITLVTEEIRVLKQLRHGLNQVLGIDLAQVEVEDQ